MSPFFERDLAAKGLDPETEAQVRSFATNGYFVIDDLGFDDFDAVADQAIADAAAMHENGAYNRVMDAWTVSETIRSIATCPRVISLLETLYGRKPIPFQTLNFFRGSQQPTHSDSYHFHSYPKHFMCGVWVAFEDISDENGPLHYYPGSHLLPTYDVFCPDREDELGPFVKGVIDAYGLRKEKAYLKRGQALIWSANLLHGGEPVADPNSTRRSQVTHYYFEDCTYNTPHRSDFARGKIYFRQITDVATGKLRPTGGVHLPLRSRLVTLRRRIDRARGKGYVRYPQ
jgi:hypothetical protein